ncbi:coiled-coil domain-containing protein 153 [Bufo bufo]|uniref:coiled-coil domain-containing protein 153 n=1 Tax=Bufo bufo TaxID=8384 RepID=UPI001ABEE0FB|nr:coiled-coil domain-containing protein 153 [Bufo bufo]
MPPKLKAKSQRKKKVKKSKAGTGSVEERFRKATLEVDVLQDHLALQKQVTRQVQQRKYELHGKLQELQEDIQDERDEKQAIYNEMTRQHRDLEKQSSARVQDLEEEVAQLKLQLSNSQQAFQLLNEESQRITEEKETEIEELKKQVESMETEYEHILHSSLDQMLARLTLAEQQWTKESLTIHQQYKNMLQDCGLNPLDI